MALVIQSLIWPLPAPPARRPRPTVNKGCDHECHADLLAVPTVRAYGWLGRCAHMQPYLGGGLLSVLRPRLPGARDAVRGGSARVPDRSAWHPRHGSGVQ